MQEAGHKSLQMVRLCLCEMSRVCKSLGTESGLVVARGLEEGEDGEWLLIPVGFILGMKKMF